MAWYQEARDGGANLDECSSRLYARIASAVIEQLDAVRAEPPVAGSEGHRMRTLYDWATHFPGGGLEAFCGSDFVEQAIQAKQRKGRL